MFLKCVNYCILESMENKYINLIQSAGLRQNAIAKEMGISKACLHKYIHNDFWPGDKKMKFLEAIKKLGNTAIAGTLLG